MAVPCGCNLGHADRVGLCTALNGPLATPMLSASSMKLSHTRREQRRWIWGQVWSSTLEASSCELIRCKLGLRQCILHGLCSN